MNERLRWGILGGTSWIARDAIMPGIRKSRNGRLVATASRDPADTRQRYGEEPGVLPDDWKEIYKADALRGRKLRHVQGGSSVAWYPNSGRTGSSRVDPESEERGGQAVWWRTRPPGHGRYEGRTVSAGLTAASGS
jgi:hypothetical protein